MIDTNDIYNRCIEAATLAVGELLAQVKSNAAGTTTKPAIFKSTDKGARGERPYMVIDIPSRVKHNNHSNDRYFDEDGNLNTIIRYDYLINFGVYGGDALGIIGELENSFVWNEVIQIFTRDNFAGIVDTYPAASTQTMGSNNVLSFASMILKLTLGDTVIESVYPVQTITPDVSVLYGGNPAP